MIDVYLVVGPEDNGVPTGIWCRKDYWDANHAIEDGSSEDYCEVESSFEDIGVSCVGDGKIEWFGLEVSDIIEEMELLGVNLLVDDESFIKSYIAAFSRDPKV